MRGGKRADLMGLDVWWSTALVVLSDEPGIRLIDFRGACGGHCFWYQQVRSQAVLTQMLAHFPLEVGRQADAPPEVAI